MPFISEDIWQRLPHEGESIPGSARSIVVAPFPKAGRKGRDAAAEREMAYVIDVVSAIRTARSESRISPAAEVEVTVRPSAEAAELLVAATPLMGALAKARVTVRPDAQRPAQSAHVVASGIDVFVHLEGVVDLAAERARLGKEIERARKEIAFLEGKLGRPDFVERAPAEVVTRERARLEEQQQILAKLGSSLAALQ
jgi:valyl-tRNA synthetase